MRDNKAVAILAALTTVGIWAGGYFSLRGGPPRLNAKPHEATGWMMARQTLDLLKPGGQIIVIARDTVAFKNPASDIQLASFKKTIQKAGQTVASVSLLQLDPLRQVEVPPGDFLELMRKTTPGSVVVSFMGPPLLNDAQCAQLGNAGPAVVAFCSGSLPDIVDLKRLFEQGLVQAAVVSRRNPTRSSREPRDLNGWFEQYFLAVTAHDTASLSSLAAR